MAAAQAPAGQKVRALGDAVVSAVSTDPSRIDFGLEQHLRENGKNHVSYHQAGRRVQVGLKSLFLLTLLVVTFFGGYTLAESCAKKTI